MHAVMPWRFPSSRTLYLHAAASQSERFPGGGLRPEGGYFIIVSAKPRHCLWVLWRSTSLLLNSLCQNGLLAGLRSLAGELQLLILLPASWIMQTVWFLGACSENCPDFGLELGADCVTNMPSLCWQHRTHFGINICVCWKCLWRLEACHQKTYLCTSGGRFKAFHTPRAMVPDCLTVVSGIFPIRRFNKKIWIKRLILV